MRKMTMVWVFVLMWTARCQAAGFQSLAVPDGSGGTIALAVWYPSDAPTALRDMGVFTQDVATGGAIRGSGLPLVIVSHGTGGNAYTHLDTALALADAGFVVAALTHPGDNHQDRSRATDILARPRQVTTVIDYMLGAWDGRAALAPGRIGIFGHSSGAFTALVSAGGKPDLGRIGPHCAAHPADYACALLAAAPRRPAQSRDARLHDARVKAAVLAAPALGFTFDAAGLRAVTIPIQLWRAEEDTLLPHPWYAEAVRQALPRAPDYRVVPGAGHFDFLAPCSEKLARIAPPICASRPGFDRAAFHRDFNARVVAFFGQALGAR